MMNELLLNCNIGGLFLTMGLPTLDPVMTSVLDYIHQHALFLGSWGGFAKALGLILAMCVTSYECWMMMLGRRGIDVMKLFRIDRSVSSLPMPLPMLWRHQANRWDV